MHCFSHSASVLNKLHSFENHRGSTLVRTSALLVISRVFILGRISPETEKQIVVASDLAYGMTGRCRVCMVWPSRVSCPVPVAGISVLQHGKKWSSASLLQIDNTTS